MVSDWAQEESAAADFGDERLNDRYAVIVSSIGNRPNLSIPAGCGGRAEMAATYRFTNNRRVTLATPAFRDAAPPDPDRDDWAEWQALLSNSESPSGEPPENALRFAMPHGYGTVSSALVALPEPNAGERTPRFRYVQWQPTVIPWADVSGGARSLPQ